MTYVSDYLDKVLSGRVLREATLEKCVCGIKEHFPDVDVLAVTGVSGTLVALPIADILGKDVVVIRKDNESSHSIFMVEGAQPTSGEKLKVVFLDDLVGTGQTIQRMAEALDKTWGGTSWIPLGAALWQSGDTLLAEPCEPSQGYQTFKFISKIKKWQLFAVTLYAKIVPRAFAV